MLAMYFVFCYLDKNNLKCVIEIQLPIGMYFVIDIHFYFEYLK